MAKAIRKRYLIHSAVLVKLNESNPFNDPTETTINLTNVLIQPTDKVVRTTNNNEQQLTSIMFFDMKNSKPKNQAFSKKDIIRFNGQDYLIEVIDQLIDTKGVHHLEIGLV